MRATLFLYLLALTCGCGDSCGDGNVLDLLFNTGPPTCRTSDDPREPEDGKRPGMLIAVHVETGDVLGIRDEHNGSGEVFHQPVAVELAPGNDFDE